MQQQRRTIACRPFFKQHGQVGLVTPGYLDEGKRYLTIAVGCTGGKHRSVAMAQELARLLGGTGMEALVMHRDLGRE